jgi:hypothetical protein
MVPVPHHWLNFILFGPVLWIGIVLMPIRIRLSIMKPIQIRIRILPQFIHKLENQNFSVIGVLIFSISDSILIFSGIKHSLSLHLLGIDRVQIRIPLLEQGHGF